MPTALDRQLLLGALARQLGFVGGNALREAVQLWNNDQTTSLAEVLEKRAGLTPDARRLLEALADEQLKRRRSEPWPGMLELRGLLSPDPQPAQDPVSTGPILTADGSPLRFRVVRPHAKGGIGEVHVARDQELHREVALKEIQEQFADDAHRRARFLQEAEITGGLEHPGTVPVYGLGVYADGRPFYAMRLIRGVTLQHAIEQFHSTDRPLAASQRRVEFQKLLSRFLSVCNTIAYAHSRGVIHRDLKPGNIMLGDYGETLVVDWGAAKVIGRDGMPDPSVEGTLNPESRDTGETLPGVAVGTPAFMSPEAAAGRIAEMGPASDIYSLGATLYALLTGQPSFFGPLGQVLQRVQRGEFVPPRKLHPQIPRPLAAICQKAMAILPADRYPSARALSADIEHWLAGEPVAVYLETLPERAGRWARRHRTPVAAASAALVVAVIVLSAAVAVVVRKQVQTAQARAQAERERDRADANYALARQAVEMTVRRVAENEILQQEGFHELRKELLESVVPFYEQLVEQSRNDPQLSAQRARATAKLAYLRHFLGDDERSLTDYAEARGILSDLVRTHPDDSSFRVDLAASYNDAGVVMMSQRRLHEAESLLRDGLRVQSELVSRFPQNAEFQRKLAGSHNNLAAICLDLGRWDDAESEWRTCLSMRRELTAAHPKDATFQRDLGDILDSLSVLLEKRGRVAEAEEAGRESVRILREAARGSPANRESLISLARSLVNLAGLLQTVDKPSAAEAAYREAILMQSTLTEQNPKVPQHRRQLALARSSYSVLLRDIGRYNDALSEGQAALELRRKLLAEFPRDDSCRDHLANSLNNHGILMAMIDRGADAEKLLREALQERQRLVRSNSAILDARKELGNAHNNLGLCLADNGKLDEARSQYLAALEVKESLAKENPRVPQFLIDLGKTYNNLGKLLADLNDADGAMIWLDRAIATLTPVAENNPRLLDAREALLRTHWSRAQLQQTRKRFDEALRDWNKAVELGTPDTIDYLRLFRAQALARVGKADEAAAEAEKLLRAAKENADLQFGLACAYSLVSGADKTDSARKDSHAVKAIEFLRQLHRAGHFKTPENLKILKKEPDLDPLRKHPEFQKLLGLVEAEAHKKGM